MGCTGAKPIHEPSEAQASTGGRYPVLTEMTPEERALNLALNQLWQIFNGIDRNGIGSVDKSELMAALACDKDAWLGALLKEAGLNETWDLGISKDGRVTWDIFETILKSPALMEVQATGPAADPQLPATEQALAYLRDVFENTNVNIDGTVLKEELAEALAADDGVQNAIQQAGLNSKYRVLQPLHTIVDGRITWEEFEAHVHRGGATPKSVKKPAKDYVMVIDFLVEEEGRVTEA